MNLVILVIITIFHPTTWLPWFCMIRAKISPKLSKNLILGSAISVSPPHAIHTGPIIRKESLYEQYDNPEDRTSLLNALYHFARKIDFRYLYPYVNKSECSDFIQLNARLSRAISSQLKEHDDFFSSFDRIIVYYDNGQNELTKILTSVFNTLYSNVEFRRVKPSDYKLFQVADLICTWETLALKAEHNFFTKSETEMFGSARLFLKNRYKLIVKKKL